MSFIPVANLITKNIKQEGEVSHRRLPPWFKVKLKEGPNYKDIRRLVDYHGLHTICEEARCPNIWECWNNRTATFLILGDICTRRCHYCSVQTGRPSPVDWSETRQIAEAIHSLRLRHVVITSVNRDDLEDGGASIFASTIREIRERMPFCTVEVLIPDFQGSQSSLDIVMKSRPDILNHNLETVPRLFLSIRPQGKYVRSLELLDRAKRIGGKTKSGIIVGMGETTDEVFSVMNDLRTINCDIVSIGQYLQPTQKHLLVDRYYTLQEFEEFKIYGKSIGFEHVESGPLVRSSYHAEQQVKRMIASDGL